MEFVLPQYRHTFAQRWTYREFYHAGEPIVSIKASTDLSEYHQKHCWFVAKLPSCQAAKLPSSSTVRVQNPNANTFVSSRPWRGYVRDAAEVSLASLRLGNDIAQNTYIGSRNLAILPSCQVHLSIQLLAQENPNVGNALLVSKLKKFESPCTFLKSIYVPKEVHLRKTYFHLTIPTPIRGTCSTKTYISCR